jgi:poly(3-hydroxyalkanoate) synthetase
VQRCPSVCSLVLDLLTERRFSDSFDAHIDTAMVQLHNVYCDVYCLFNHWWNAANPENIMQFAAVFGTCGFSLLCRMAHARAVIHFPGG